MTWGPGRREVWTAVIRRDPYQVLGIGRDADQAAIRKAYHELVIRFHPDRNPDDAQAAEHLRNVVAAYELLSDPRRKAAYDRHGGPVEKPGRTESRSGAAKTVRTVVTEFLDELAARSENRKRGRDVTVSVLVDFSEAVCGTKKTVRFDAPIVCPLCHGIGGDASRQGAVEICRSCSGRGRVAAGPAILGLTRECTHCSGSGRIVREPCERCRGTGMVTAERELTITIPPGTVDGAVRVVKGQGGPGARGGERGDLEVVIRVREHPLLRRRGRDVVCRVPLPVTEAILGTKLRVPTVRGGIDIDITPGMSAGQIIRIKGRGVPDERGVGDQLVELELELPRDLAPDQVALLERFAQTLTEKNSPASHRYRSLLSGGSR